MRLDDYRTSDNVGDERGQSPGGGGFGGGGGGLGLLLSLVGSRFGIGGIIVVVVGAMLLGYSPFGGGSSGVMSPAQQTQVGASTASQACHANDASLFSCHVLASTEDTWGKIFAASGQTYTPAALIFYGGQGSSGCGVAQSAMGPFYCPTDHRIYLDTSFYSELQNRFGAAGDFAQAYVIAHEVGHHIQYLQGIFDKAQQAQSGLSTAKANAVQVKVELQADCYAGVWAAHNKDRLDPGDVEEGMRAAQAIGDDTLEKQTQGYVVPDSFTHGTSAQRMQWLRTGIESGDPAKCDTFQGTV